MPCYPGEPRSTNGATPLHTACLGGHIGVVHDLLSAGARADLHDVTGMTPLDLLPRPLRAEMERLVQQAKEERDNARTDKGRVGAPSAPAAVLPPPHHQSQPASCMQPAKMAVKPPLRVPVGCWVRPAASAAVLRPSSVLHVREPTISISFIWWSGQAQGVWVLHVRALLFTRVSE